MKTIFSFCLLMLSCMILLAQQSDASLIASSERISFTDTDENGITVETRIVIEKEKERAKIVFWQETNNGFLFKNVDWTGTVRLKLDNGKTIKLIDREMNGHEMHKGGHIGGYFVPDLYQRYSAYYLTDAECELLKQHKLIKVEYRLDDEYETAIKYLDLSDKQYFIKDQLTAVGK